MKYLLSCLFLVQSLFSIAKPDPGAKKLLTKSENYYKSFSSTEIDFSIETKPAEAKTSIEKGTYTRQGDAFKLISDRQDIYVDGKIQWTYLKKQNEIQVSNYYKSDKNRLDPMQFIDLYKSADYDYRTDDDLVEKGINYHQIEFKILDKNSDLFKIKISLHKKTNAIHKIFLYQKNGDRTTIQFIKFKSNIKYAVSDFQLDPKKYPKAHVEDLREE